MEAKSIGHTQQFLRQRKFMTILPLLILPFVIIFFVALGGGKGNISTNGARRQSGFNTMLPDAHFKKGKEKDKMGIYEEANKDSAKRHDEIKNDPYYTKEPHANDTFKNETVQLQNILQHNAAKFNQPNYSKLQTSPANFSADSNEQRVIRKLEQLKKALSKKSSADYSDNSQYQKNGNEEQYTKNSSVNPDANKLQNMLQMMNAKNNEPDPEVNQLNNMLDKVMLIQHPEKMQDSMKKLSEKNKAQTFVVTTSHDDNNITLLDSNNNHGQSSNAFYGLSDDENKTQNEKQNAIEAIIPESQTLISGAAVKLRLLNDIFVNGIKIPKDEFVYGTASLNNERLKIAINSLRYQNNILPVSLEVYDMDGMQGIYIPGSINRDVSKQSADDAISTFGLNSVDQSVGTQAALAGIEAAKTLASRKIKLIRVTIKSGYKVLLKDSNQK
ncbi:MAG TPA: conjugative transposon protein TraM [Puia sp.]|jgi:conjugative transposon TraM protein|nr:conjugative transposon protein TraM [Puia sp.]